MAASARAYHLPVGSSCLPLSAQHGTALPHRPAPTCDQRWLPAASMLVVVGHARCSSHRTCDHRWQCVQFNCSSSGSHIILVFPNYYGMAIFRQGHYNGGVECKGMKKSRFRPTFCYISEIQDTAIVVTMAD